VLTDWQWETHAGSAWDSLDTNAADAATSTAITTVSDKNFMLICLALGQAQARGLYLWPVPSQRQSRTSSRANTFVAQARRLSHACQSFSGLSETNAGSFSISKHASNISTGK
jgi:hypothetical protein